VSAWILFMLYYWYTFETKNPAKPTGCDKGGSPNEWTGYCQDLYYYLAAQEEQETGNIADT
jgi:hypothetical protein